MKIGIFALIWDGKHLLERRVILSLVSYSSCRGVKKFFCSRRLRGLHQGSEKQKKKVRGAEVPERKEMNTNVIIIFVLVYNLINHHCSCFVWYSHWPLCFIIVHVSLSYMIHYLCVALSSSFMVHYPLWFIIPFTSFHFLHPLYPYPYYLSLSLSLSHTLSLSFLLHFHS